MPWISTEEFMSFDFEKASLEAPPRGPRYRALPRVIDRMAEAKAFCRVDLVHSKNLALSKARQAACLVEASKLVEEMQERGVTPTVHVLNAHLSVYSKSLQFGEAREFLAEQFGAANLKPNQQTFLHLIEMYIRGGRLKEALDLKEEMASSFGLRPGSAVLGQLVRKLADLDRLMEALALLDEAQDAGIKIRERWRTPPLPAHTHARTNARTHGHTHGACWNAPRKKRRRQGASQTSFIVRSRARTHHHHHLPRAF